MLFEKVSRFPNISKNTLRLISSPFSCLHRPGFFTASTAMQMLRITGRLKSERETHSKRIADLTAVVHVAKVEVHVVRIAIAALRTRLIEGQRAKSLVYNLLALIHFYFRFLSLSLLRKIKHINSL